MPYGKGLAGDALGIGELFSLDLTANLYCLLADVLSRNSCSVIKKLIDICDISISAGQEAQRIAAILLNE